jgi:3-phosphoshikimate 1-carboxyvinyltransferase
MVMGALTGERFTLRNPLLSDDTKATLEALSAMDADIGVSPGHLSIHCGHLKVPAKVLDARNSGTTIRLMSGIASLFDAPITLTGDASLVKRPMAPLVDSLVQLGAECAYIGQHGRPPLRVRGPITKPNAEVEGGVSSQFVSSLLIACTQKKTDTVLTMKGDIASRPYVDITLEMLRQFGGEVNERASGFAIRGNQRLRRDSYTVPGDYSSAAFLLAAAAVTDGTVTVRNLESESAQGDRRILDHLRSFGAKVSRTPQTVTVSGGRMTGTEIDVGDTPDLFPVLAVVGSLAEGRTVLRGGGNLRAKESDRIATTTKFLQDMGARIRPRKDGCEIIGVPKLAGARVETHGDHRILMAATIAALASGAETVIEDDESFKVSYPGFVRDLHQLGCRVEVRK